MSEIKNGRLDLNDAEHSNCNRMMTLGFKGLIPALWNKRVRFANLFRYLQHTYLLRSL